MRKAKALGIFSAALILGSFPVLADQAPDALPLATIANEPLLVSADMREGTELSGTWHYSIDPYRAGIAGFHGETPDRGQQRWLDIDVRKEMAMDNRTMFEFDMAHSLTTALPGSWLAASPELRHYQGVVWYQRHFDAPSNRKGRYFLRFGAANYATTAYLNGKPLGRHEGGFTPFAFEVTQRCAMVIIRSPLLSITGNAHHRSAHRHRLGKLRRRHARHSVGPHACHLCRQCDGPPDHGWQAGGRSASRWRGGGGAEHQAADRRP
jgi:hypothetical protein